MSENPPIPEGTLLAGKLRVLRLLGMGGMGAVYEVEHELTKHRRALKLLHAEMRAYPTVVARFLREASAAGRIGNPHIIETFDAGELETGEPYLVMEFLKGETLADLIGRRGPLPVGELAGILAQAANGVHAAHTSGIVHRDLKPENLYLVDRDGKPFVKLLDFGVSKFDAELTGGMGVTKEGSTIGTPFYMPPEQVRGSKDIDARADVYALGVILYECATGKRPFEAETLPHLALLIHEGKPVPLAELRPELPQAFIDVVTKAMSPDPAQRFQSAKELAQALARFSDDDTLGATLAGEAAIARVVVKPSTPPAAGGAHAATAPGAAVSVAEEKRKPAGAVALAAVVVTALAGGGVYAAFGRGGPPAAASATSADLMAAASATPTTTTTATTTSTTTSTPTATPTASASAAPTTSPSLPALVHHTTTTAATAKPAATAAATPTPTPTPTAKPAATTRADQKGLANDNPFK